MSAGRFRLGLGTANVANVLTPLGIPPRNRVDRIQDAVVIIRDLLEGKEVSFEGTYDQLSHVRLHSATSFHVPVYLGTRGARMLAVAGELAQGVLVESIFWRDGMEHVRSRLRIGAARSGRPLADFDLVSWQVVLVTDDPRATVEQLRPWVLRTFENGPPEAIELVGIESDTITRVRALSAAGDRDSALRAIPDSAVHSLMVIGRPREVIERLKILANGGARTVSILSIGGVDETVRNLRRIAVEVMPEVNR